MKMYAVMVICMFCFLGCGGGGGGSGSGSVDNPVSGGGGGGSVDTPVEKKLVSISVVPADNVLAVGLQKQFTATGTYSDGEEKDLTAEVIWKSSDSRVATVSNDAGSKGLVNVLATSAQRVVVTATLDAVSGTTHLTVPVIELVTIAVTPANPTLAAGTSVDLTATGTYSDGTTSDITGAVQWKSAEIPVATVAATGRVSGVAVGISLVSATMGTVTGSTTLTVTSAALQSVSIAANSTSLAAGTKQQLTATGLFSDGSSQVLTTAVTWISSTPSVATITPDGMATAVAVGTATISAVYQNVTYDTVLTITGATLQSIAITPGLTDLAAGSTRQMNVIATYSDSSTQNISSSATWSTSAPAIAAISQDGILMAMDAGSASITAAFAGFSASRNITVTPAVVSGRWIGTYTINAEPPPKDPSQIGTYSFIFDFTQNGSDITGTTTLRGIANGELTGKIIGRRIEFRFTYLSPISSVLMENLGSLEITDAAMVGSAVENYLTGFNCSYYFSVTRP